MMNYPWVHLVGGGAASLSLAIALAKYERLPGDVVITDPKASYHNDRTFGFWFRPEEARIFQPEYSLASWSFGSHQENITHYGRRYRYGVRSSQSLYDAAFEKIGAHPQIQFQRGTVLDKPKACHVFDSRPPAIENFYVTQAFSGLEIRCSKAHGVQTVGLMEAIECLDCGVRFRYLLPLDEYRLLIEHTVFSARQADLVTLHKLNCLWREENWPASEVIRHESASIPMGLCEPMQHFGIPIGARGGMTRPATGYGYRNMSIWAIHAARLLVEKDRAAGYRSPQIHEWMDRLFLDLIRYRPQEIPEVLLALARRLNGDRFAQFMMRGNLVDAFRTIIASPKRPFFCALMNLK